MEKTTPEPLTTTTLATIGGERILSVHGYGHTRKRGPGQTDAKGYSNRIQKMEVGYGYADTHFVLCEVRIRSGEIERRTIQPLFIEYDEAAHPDAKIARSEYAQVMRELAEYLQDNGYRQPGSEQLFAHEKETAEEWLYRASRNWFALTPTSAKLR